MPSPSVIVGSPMGVAKSLKRKASGIAESSVKRARVDQSSEKEPCIGEPAVWADKRQNLCSSLPGYRAYQSGAYTKDGIMLGSLLDSFPGQRDLVDSDGHVIISVGGGRDSKDDNGKMMRKADQGCGGTAFKGATQSMATSQWIVLISGDSNPVMATKMPHAYNVLGWYFITDMWCEVDGDGFKFHKMKAQAINFSTRPWFAPVSKQHDPMTTIGDFKAQIGKCGECGEQSKQIFQQGWTCLTKTCVRFFDFGTEIDNDELSYDEAFLKERKAYPGMEPLSAESGRLFPPSLIPAIPHQGDNDFGTEKHLREGFVCPRCHGCNSRKNWSGWVYETPGCGYQHGSNMKAVPIQQIHANNKNFAKKRAIVNTIFEKLSENIIVGSHTVTVYPMPDLTKNGDPSNIVGVLVHMRPNEAVLGKPMGADESFTALHKHAAEANWQRLPVRHKGLKSEILTKHFTQNYGVPYKYVVTVSSRPFQEAPDTIIAALMRMRWAAKTAIKLAETRVDSLKDHKSAQSLEFSLREFNELLALGYFEEDKIGWHDDGEDTIGATVATWSLGAPAKMGFCVKDDTKRSSVLDIKLLHGDLIVMHGAEIHKKYLHRVVPSGNRRFALTSRHILLSKIEADGRETAKALGTMPQHASNFTYDGN